jgi:MFS family permease
MAGSWASTSALTYNGGAILGYIAAGFLADAIGRKPYMYLMFIGAILSGLVAYLAAQTLSMALASVFVLGVFTLGIFPGCRSSSPNCSRPEFDRRPLASSSIWRA